MTRFFARLRNCFGRGRSDRGCIRSGLIKKEHLIPDPRVANPEDADQMTVTFPLVGPLENAPDAFFRVDGN